MVKNFLVMVGILVLSIFNSASAALVDNGEGLIYDTDRNVTWLNSTGRGYLYGMSWQAAVEWAYSLNAGGLRGWRLPRGLYSSRSTSDEIQHLVFQELSNPHYGPLLNKGLLTDLVDGGRYWLAEPISWDKAWTFDFDGNVEGGMYQDWDAYALALHDGKIGPTGYITTAPIPSAFLLFVPGLLFISSLFTRHRALPRHRRKLFDDT